MVPLRSRVNPIVSPWPPAACCVAIGLLILTTVKNIYACANFVLPEFYHSTEEISGNLNALEARCPNMSIRREALDDVNSIDIVFISGSLPVKTNRTRFFMLAGEHARELITPESALHFVTGKGFRQNRCQIEQAEHMQYSALWGSPRVT